MEEWISGRVEPAAVVGVHAQPCGVHEGVGYDAQHGWGKGSGVVEGREFGGGEQRQRWFGDYVEFSCLGQEHGVGGLGCGVSREGIEAFFALCAPGCRRRRHGPKQSQLPIAAECSRAAERLG